jgi:hypothetical protein
VTRERSPGNRREVLIALTPSGVAALAHLSVLHREQLRTAGPALHEVIAPFSAASRSRIRPAADVDLTCAPDQVVGMAQSVS